MSKYLPIPHPDTVMCTLCDRFDVGTEGLVDLQVCLTCAWKVVEHLSSVYRAPEITVLQRIRHEQKYGKEGAIPRREREEIAARTAGYVYYIRNGGLIKIGYAADVAKRMRSYPPNVELAAAHPGTKEVERQMHVRFQESLSDGREWFEPTPDLEEHIAQVREVFGDPSSLAYRFTKPKTQEEKARDQMKPGHTLGGMHPIIR